MNLTEDQYNRLKPYRPVLDLFGNYGTMVGTNDNNRALVSIHKELDPNGSTCITCGGELVAVYRRLIDFIKEYENGKV